MDGWMDGWEGNSRVMGELGDLPREHLPAVDLRELLNCRHFLFSFVFFSFVCQFSGESINEWMNGWTDGWVDEPT